MQHFTCTCGNVLFFNSSRCLKCGTGVGYDPLSRRIQPVLANGGPFKRCANGIQHAVCNWLLPTTSAEVFCSSCRLNRTIPDLRSPRNQMLWSRMEAAKHRLLHTLHGLGFSVPTQAENPVAGLAFDIVSTVVDPTVTTGHLQGVITLNLEEADDTYRQINRQQLGESSRTLLGHFRHESGHYVWHRFLAIHPESDPQRQAFRQIFGDETLNYATALGQHYQKGAPAGWDQHYITAYAASHPWEDWAETWAHYLQIIDGLETCESYGIRVTTIPIPLIPLPPTAGTLPPRICSDESNTEDTAFLSLLQRWLCLSATLNEISQSLGEAPLYPFIITIPIARKLRLAHHYAKLWRESI